MLRAAPSSSLVASLLFAPMLPAQQPADPTVALRPWLAPTASTPPAAELSVLVRQLDGLLQSPDPALRDELGFALLTKWLYRDRCLEPAERRWLLAQWLPRLRQGIDTPGTDTQGTGAVAARSFAALSLSLLVALDNDEPFLTVDEFASIANAAIAYLRDERDVRGHDGARGWLHSVAHTADLLKFVSRSRHLAPAQQGAILNAIADKLARTDVALTHGEDARLARAVLALLLREDLDRTAALRWLQELAGEQRGETNAQALARAHNRSGLLAQLHLLLAAETRALPRLDEARALVLAALRGEAQPTAVAAATAPANPTATPAAATADVASIDAIVQALYASISGPAGHARDWARVRSLFHRHHQMLPMVRGKGGMQAMRMTVDDYVQRAGAMLERDGFFEQEVARQVLQFGDVAHVWSTYEARRALADAVPFLRGINSIQLVREGGRWWVLGLGWEQEADAGPIPAAFLPASTPTPKPESKPDSKPVK